MEVRQYRVSLHLQATAILSLYVPAGEHLARQPPGVSSTILLTLHGRAWHIVCVT